MHGWLLLVWVQGLIQAAFLATGATAGTIDTKRNISAEEGGSVILQCHFSSDTAEVTQVDWKQQDQLLAIYSVDLGWHVASVFSDRVVPGPSLGLTFQSLTMNDTGEYFCTYHTYPGGIYKGRIFLKVQESSVAQFQTAPLGGTMAAVLGLICLMVTGVTVLARKMRLLPAPAYQYQGYRQINTPCWTSNPSCLQTGSTNEESPRFKCFTLIFSLRRHWKEDWENLLAAEAKLCSLQ
ncbi:T-cell immunoreceptor with Ig and ITIM domains isoform X1 [Mus musculus]|uniref:T-cell immunoreceptor with Ig and ITIM domains isoform X1 n=1 Tax=Mus musculus TaxID=10090 RepID=UPI0007EE0D62|nr:T-cell immunoreceptor with Ig and ITIM domains isoform X1 [Mus musculus]|eukprot:XP_017172323.1 PREDICTED: T-cell immunoreceptor with Ig and ITIM domains isoform X1 [Mus musculus]